MARAWADGFWNFNPRTSCEVRRTNCKPATRDLSFQSTHLMRGATVGLCRGLKMKLISIHAPHARCDMHHPFLYLAVWHFNPRTSCEVRQQPQLLLRPLINFNPRTSCEVRRYYCLRFQQSLYFNPRTSCEVRHITNSNNVDVAPFQSTHLMRGATR